MITYSQLGDLTFGRLGNQLFQIASTIGIAEANNQDFIFPEWSYSEYFMNKLPVGKLTNTHIYSQQHKTYYPVKLNPHLNWDLKGYFQSELYFKNAENLVRHYLEPSENVTNYIKNKYQQLFQFKTCSLHVRRGDYLIQQSAFPAQPIAYYNAAIELIGADHKFLVFSDDIDWCKQKFIGEKFHFIEGEEDIIDLFMMSFCNSNILSNSSFSWWGAWLNKTTNKTMICPENWFGPAYAFNVDKSSKDIFASGFQKLVLPKTGINKYAKFFAPTIFVYFQTKRQLIASPKIFAKFILRKLKINYKRNT